MPVHLNRPPHNVRLVAWGRADDGWWGCVTWEQRVRADDGETQMGFAAWVPAGALSRPGWTSESAVPRMRLPLSRQSWPAPPGWPNWYAGVWADGLVAAPPGVEIVRGPRWRNR